MMFSLIDNYTQEVLATSDDRTKIEKELHDWQDETGLFIYSIVEKSTEQGEALQNGASGCNKLGEDITLYLPGEEGLGPHVSWSGCAGYDAMSFYVETEDEARALYYALITIKDVEAD